ncbi:MAG: sulfotransferase family protein [bacterium]
MMFKRVVRLILQVPGAQALKARVLDLSDRLNWARNRIRYGDLAPTFAVIGAQKAATTSLHFYLSQHPEIFMSRNKKEHNLFLADSDERGSYCELEPFFYGSSSRQKRGGLTDDQILCRMFRGYRGERVIGDASPYYTNAPFAGIETPARMYHLKPEMRIIYSLRNPLERMISNYLHDVRINDWRGQPITDDFNTRIRTRSHFLETSLYFNQLKRYLEFFPADQIHVLLFEDLLARPDSTLAALTRFLRVDEGFKFDVSHSHAASPNRKPSNEFVFSHENFTRFIEPIRRDIAAMEDFLGRSLAIWDLSEERWCQIAGISEEAGPESKTSTS